MFQVLPLLGLLIWLHGAPVAAQVVCGNRDVMVENLVKKYGEVQMSLGLSGSNLFETWANCSTGTWTILKTHPKGRACLAAAGESWQGVGCKFGKPV